MDNVIKGDFSEKYKGPETTRQDMFDLLSEVIELTDVALLDVYDDKEVSNITRNLIGAELERRGYKTNLNEAKNG